MAVTKTTRKIASKMKTAMKAMKAMMKALKLVKEMKALEKDDKDKQPKKDNKDKQPKKVNKDKQPKKGVTEKQLAKLFREEPDLVNQMNKIPKGVAGSTMYMYPGFIACITFDHDRRGNLRINKMTSSIDPV